MGTKISALSTATAAETQSGFVPIITGTSGSFTTKRTAVSNIGGSGGSVTISSTAPTATNGALWFNEDSGELYIYSSDLNGWIQTNGGGGGSGGEVYDSGWIVCSTSTSGIGKYMDFTHSLGEQPQNITVLLSGSSSGANAWEAHTIFGDSNNNNILGYQAAEIGNTSMRIWMSQYGVQEHKGSAWSGDASSNGATTHQWGSGNASYIRVIATVGAGGGGGSVYSTGWSTSKPSAFSDVTYSHNLGTEDIQYQVYVRDSSGNEHDVTGGEVWHGAGTFGCSAVNITSTAITIKFFSGYLDWVPASNSVNPVGRAWSVATHIKVVVTG